MSDVSQERAAEASHQDIRLSMPQLVFFNRQLASMARLNMPIARGLKVMAKEIDDARFRALIDGVQRDLAEGLSLDEALEKYPSTFSRIYIELLRAGEATGNVAVILDQLSEYSETFLDVRTRLRDALSYPLLVGAVTLSFLVYFFVEAVPKFKLFFLQGYRELSNAPLQTRFLLGLSDLLQNPFFSVPAGLILVGGVVFLLSKLWRGMESFDQFMFKIPLFGTLFFKATLLKLNRTLHDLLVNGVSLVNGLDLVSHVVGENEVRDRLAVMQEQLAEGGNFSDAVAEGNTFPDTMTWKLQMAHERGSLEEALYELSKEYEADIESTASFIMRILGPLLLIFICGVVGFIFAAFYPPLLEATTHIR